MILTPALLMLASGVHVRALGDAKLRFAEGAGVSLASAATLSPNDKGLLADVAGRPVLPQIRVSTGSLSVLADGTIRVSGKTVGRLFLARPDGELGHPGDPSFGLLQINGSPIRPQAGLIKPIARVLGTATIAIHAASELEGDRVLLRDVADLSGDPALVARLGAVDLGSMPSLGVKRSLSSWTVKAALRTQGIPESSVVVNYPPQATVARKSQTIDDETLVAEARDKARQAVPYGDLNVVGTPSAMVVPCGEVTFGSAFQRSGDHLTVTIDVLVGGKKAGSSVVRLTAKGGGIKANDIVHIVISRNGAVVEVEGKAKSAGAVGETIQVATKDGGELTATVTGPGTVEVKL